jgi:hypothetical protein
VCHTCCCCSPLAPLLLALQLQPTARIMSLRRSIRAPHPACHLIWPSARQRTCSHDTPGACHGHLVQTQLVQTQLVPNPPSQLPLTPALQASQCSSQLDWALPTQLLDMRAHVRGNAFGAIVVQQDKLAQQDGQQWEADRRAYQAKTRSLLDAQRWEQEQARAAELEAKRAEARALLELQQQVRGVSVRGLRGQCCVLSFILQWA